MRVLVRKSKIQGRGVFANQDFKKGEVVLRWKPKMLTKIDLKNVTAREKHFIYKAGRNKYLLEQPPERYVNHSCGPNTKVIGLCDVAIKPIKKGEEITSKYTKASLPVGFVCRCGSKSASK